MTDRRQLAAVLERDYPLMDPQWCERTADWMLNDADPLLRTTIGEYAAGKPLSDIGFDGPDGKRYSAVEIMRQRGNRDVVGALRWMERFFEEPELAVRAIRRPLL